MTAAQTILLDDARTGLRRLLRSFRGADAADRLFAAWLLGEDEAGFVYDEQVQEVLATGAVCGNYRNVAALGYAAAHAAPLLPFSAELRNGLQWLLSRPWTMSGSPAAFVTDPVGVLGVCLGLASLMDGELTEPGRRWVAELSDQFIRNPTAEPWEVSLIAAGRFRAGLSLAGHLPDGDGCAECRVALRGRGGLPAVYPAQREQDESAALRMLLQRQPALPWHRAVILSAAYDLITRDALQTTVGISTVPAAMTGTDGQPKKVFISYSWDSETHQKRVVKLAQDLRQYGFNATIDVFHPSPPEGMPSWMLNQIRRSDFVLMVCTETYRKRCEGDEEPGKGLGVKWEGGIVTRSIYQAEFVQRKFIPVVLDRDAVASIPTILVGNT